MVTGMEINKNYFISSFTKALLISVAFAPTIVVSATDAATGIIPGKTFRDCADCPEMVVIPPGSANIGSTHEERVREGVPPAFGEHEGPVVRVTIAKPFAMAKTETTRGQFEKFVAESNRPIPNSCATYIKKTDTWGPTEGMSWRTPGFAQTDEHPAVCISWVDANDFAQWLAKKTGKKYRLASEAEWEYAARGGTTTTRYWGDASQPICEKASVMTSATIAAIGTPESWMDKLVCASDRSWTIPVASFEANPFGLHDMLGSVWEWTADCASVDHVGMPTDGSPQMKGNCDRRGVKGGAFHSVPWLARPATHGAGQDPHNRPVASGIRVVRDLN